MKLQIESALIDASPFERIPLFELLLSAGASALQNSEDFPHNITRTFLRYEPGSTEEKMLDAYLSVAPAHERTVSLAYLLSQAGENKSSVKNIFEVFQTVGVKFGQLSSTWKLFGEEIARETASLKNNARPMSKAEIEEAMRQELSPAELSRIKALKKVVGSASLKTVVLVELTDGREVVMLLRRPHAAEQIESNLRLGQEFLRELDRRGMSQASAMFDAILDAVRQQLAEEIQFAKEAESIRTAKKYFEDLNSSMRAQLGGWRFAVPDLVEGFQVRDSILFMEKAEGATYDQLSPQDRAEAGPLIAESSLRLLFRQGWFDADRHTGNQLIDPEKKIMYLLDFGQAAAYSKKGFWQSDDRYELAQFLRAFSEGNAPGVLRHGHAMSTTVGPADLSALQDKLGDILAGKGSLPDRLIALVSAFTEQGQRLDGKFTFGAFKGLMTLYGESYVSEEGFRALLSREIASLLKRKLPRTLADRRAGR
jgi:ubiquinone biosynthesis protein